MDEAYISHTFSTCGPVSNVKLVRDNARAGLPTGFGFVQFASRESAESLLERLNGELFESLEGYRFKVNWATYGIGESRHAVESDASVYVGNLDTTISDIQLFKFFSQRFKSVAATKVVHDGITGAPKGYAFVRFRDAGDAEAAITQLQGAFCGSRPLKLRRAQKSARYALHHGGHGPTGEGGGPMPATAAAAAARGPGHWLFIGGTYSDRPEADLIATLGIFGTIYRMQTHEDGIGTFLEFRDRAGAEAMRQHFQEQLGVPAILLEADGRPKPVQHMEMDVLPAITNMTTSQAATQLHVCAKAQLDALPQPSSLHFRALLQDPHFILAFERRLASRGAGGGGEEGPPGLRSCLLEDEPGLFPGKLRVPELNDAFLRARGSGRSGARGLLSVPTQLRDLD